MKRPLKLSLTTCGVAVVLGTLFWMRSLASWRPQKVGVLPKGYIPQYMDSSGNYLTVANMGATKPEDMGSFESFDLKTGQSKKWSLAKQVDDVPNPNLSWGWIKRKGLLWSIYSASKKDPGNSILELRDASTGQLKHTLAWGPREYDLSPDMDVADKTLRVLSRNDFREFDLTTDKLKRLVALKQPFDSANQYIPRFAIASNGKALYGCAGTEGRVWDARTGKLLNKWMLGQNGLNDVPQFSPDGLIVVHISTLSPTAARCYFLDSTTGKVRWTEDNSVQITDLFLADLFIGTEAIVLPKRNNCEVRDVATGRVLRQLPGPRESDSQILRVTPDYIYTQNAKGEIFRWRAH
ncbi:hypothetical protein IAD21_01966 [Abditibacteriota bacterium]|nr:hypothetical protein IAD21_01966 [Abditibacteriota bacterium]